MRILAQAAATLVANLLQGDGGLRTSWRKSEAALPEIVVAHRSHEIDEKAVRVQYPRICVYCARVENTLQEKFRSFSGRLQMVIEVRVSGDRIDELEDDLQSCADTVADVLERNRGEIGSGFMFSGKYAIDFDSIQRGGRSYLQTATFTFDLEMSRG